jgi:putative MATE family efflux protein
MSKAQGFLNKYLFCGKQFYRQLFILALPITLQNLITSGLNMIDTIMLGWVGETEIAAVGIANQYFFLFNLIFIGIFSGCSVFIAQFWGHQNEASIRKVLGLGLLSASLVALLFSLCAVFFPAQIMMVFSKDGAVIHVGSSYLRIVGLSYLFTAVGFGYSAAARSIGNTVLPMLVSTLALLCNTILNYLLIFGHGGMPALGVEGAAIATVVARLLEVMILVAFADRIPALQVRWRDLQRITGEYVARIYKTVLPVILNDTTWGLAFVVYSVVFARMSTQAITAVQITNTVHNLFFVVIFGIANAAAVMIGHRIGEGKEEEGGDYAWSFALLSLASGVVLGLFLAICAPYILSSFKISREVYQSALFIMYFTALFMPIRVFSTVGIVGVLRGGGDVRFAFVTEAFTMWCIGVPVAFWSAFVLHCPVEYVVILISIEELTKSLVVLYRLVSQRWLKNVIQGMEI